MQGACNIILHANIENVLSQYRKGVCIAGMHRSGTSMVTSLLKDCGLYLGAEEDLIEKAPDNAEGFWENKKFVGLNEDIVAHFGGTWDKPPVPGRLPA